MISKILILCALFLLVRISMIFDEMEEDRVRKNVRINKKML